MGAGTTVAIIGTVVGTAWAANNIDSLGLAGVWSSKSDMTVEVSGRNYQAS